ncbi:hypothetical protein SDC9_170287 [bioreactor metagenome]|uniref:Uncharacterized protein n=1 Tax=bioreactor metagenome TaxID=1076179 RepID=A0A645GAA2_9ZZZZ
MNLTRLIVRKGIFDIGTQNKLQNISLIRKMTIKAADGEAGVFSDLF